VAEFVAAYATLGYQVIAGAVRRPFLGTAGSWATRFSSSMDAYDGCLGRILHECASLVLRQNV
jgi:hypothetical protein